MSRLDDFIVHATPSGRKVKKYRHYCKKCGIDRGYVYKKSLKNRLCHKCSVQKEKGCYSEETRERMSKAKMGHTPWNKGLKGKYKLPKNSISQKGKILPLEHRQKISVGMRDIQEFNGFATPGILLDRAKFRDMGLSTECLRKANYICDLCSKIGGELHAHHLNSFAKFPEQRFKLDNLVCLCIDCHKKVHSKFGQHTAEKDYKSLKLNR